MNDMDNMTANSDVQRLDFNTPALQRKRRIRALKDHLARWYVSIGGLAVLGAITLIFFYLAQHLPVARIFLLGEVDVF